MRTLEKIQNEINTVSENKLDVESSIAIYDVFENISYNDFEEFLNETEVEVCGVKYGSGYILRNIDPYSFDIQYEEYVLSHDLEEFDSYNELIASLSEANDKLEELMLELEQCQEAIQL